jgi:hypothetical protein
MLYGDLEVARLKINITEVFGSFELVEEIVDLGNWVSVPDYDFI